MRSRLPFTTVTSSVRNRTRLATGSQTKDEDVQDELLEQIKEMEYQVAVEKNEDVRQAKKKVLDNLMEQLRRLYFK